MKCYVIFSRVPGFILLILWFIHLSDLISNRADGEEFKHPWTIFAIVVSLCLFLFHTLVYLILTFHLYDTKGFLFFLPKKESSYHEYELTLVSLDLVWSICWLVQCATQTFIPETHRIYPSEAIRNMIVLYFFQIVLTLPLLIVFIRKQDLKTSKKLKSTPPYILSPKDIQLSHEYKPHEVQRLLSGGD